MPGVMIDPLTTPYTSVASPWICSIGCELVVLLTFTLTEADRVLPAPSSALNIKVWEPVVLAVLFHEKLYAAVVPLAYRLPSTYNSTLVTPLLSEVVPDIR